MFTVPGDGDLDFSKVMQGARASRLFRVDHRRGGAESGHRRPGATESSGSQHSPGEAAAAGLRTVEQHAQSSFTAPCTRYQRMRPRNHAAERRLAARRISGTASPRTSRRRRRARPRSLYRRSHGQRRYHRREPSLRAHRRSPHSRVRGRGARRGVCTGRHALPGDRPK